MKLLTPRSPEMCIRDSYNGMALLSVSVAVEYIVIAIVLIAAVTVDSVARRGNTAR